MKSLSPVQLVESLEKCKHFGKNIMQFNCTGKTFESTIWILGNVCSRNLPCPQQERLIVGPSGRRVERYEAKQTTLKVMKLNWDSFRQCCLETHNKRMYWNCFKNIFAAKTSSHLWLNYNFLFPDSII